ncbi:DUF4942 domain-containing protein [Acuticoccus sediminis]|uniref:DUF4942 domain-containing protein n=1 Tax=Acuticoccus sediminis TaxID=2184697 RepID=UPI001CFD29CA|nr:DUF4942 domain-containing protein [Acuticoccus sediminis]
MTQGAVIRRATVEEIVAQRNEALTLYGRAHDAILAARDAIRAARTAGAAASPGVTSMNVAAEHERMSFLGDREQSITIPERDEYLTRARRITDANVWAHLVQVTNLDALMDREAKDQLRGQLQSDPPEVTVDNVLATFESTVGDAGTIFKRGIANAFSTLDRRFRSHDGWKIGSRVVLTYVLNDWGGWAYYGTRGHQTRDTLIDIERVFLILDGKAPTATYAGIVGVLEAAAAEKRGSTRSFSNDMRQLTVEGDYFRVRTFLNGNAHLWFTRKDLVERVNQLLGEYYGAPIPEERDRDDQTGAADPMARVKTTPAKRYGFFPTPERAVAEVLHLAELYRAPDDAPLRVLEPSAGTGNLARPIAEHVTMHRGVPHHRTAVVDCVELQPNLADELRRSGLYRRVDTADFLTLAPRPEYDLIVMNPPFDRERDIDHVWHAMRFLKPGGRLVAIMSAGTEFRETGKSKAFRAEMERLRARWTDLPPGSFSTVGTNMNTLIVSFRAAYA